MFEEVAADFKVLQNSQFQLDGEPESNKKPGKMLYSDCYMDQHYHKLYDASHKRANRHKAKQKSFEMKRS